MIQAYLLNYTYYYLNYKQLKWMPHYNIINMLYFYFKLIFTLYMTFVFNECNKQSLDIERDIEVVISKKLDAVGKLSSCSCSSKQNPNYN